MNASRKILIGNTLRKRRKTLEGDWKKYPSYSKKYQ